MGPAGSVGRSVRFGRSVGRSRILMTTKEARVLAFGWWVLALVCWVLDLGRRVRRRVRGGLGGGRAPPRYTRGGGKGEPAEDNGTPAAGGLRQGTGTAPPRKASPRTPGRELPGRRVRGGPGAGRAPPRYSRGAGGGREPGRLPRRRPPEATREGVFGEKGLRRTRRREGTPKAHPRGRERRARGGQRDPGGGRAPTRDRDGSPEEGLPENSREGVSGEKGGLGAGRAPPR